MQGITVGLIASGAMALLIFFFHESIKSLIAKRISNLTPQQVNRIFVVVLLVLTFLAFGIGDVITETVASEPVVQEQIMSKEEKNLELIKLGVNTGKELRADIQANKRKKDSIRQALKDRQWVYQIGPPISEKRDLFNKYRLLKDRRMGNFYIFKESRKNYLIILDDGQEEAIVKANFAAVREDLYPIEPDIQVIDLMSHCSWKETIRQVDNIDVRKETITLPCRECNKP